MIRTARPGLFLVVLVACSDGGTEPGARPAAAAPEAGTDAARPRPDPFCAGRPKLPFCEDFDDRPAPGLLRDEAPDARVVVALDADPSAPSSPNALALSTAAVEPVARWLATPELASASRSNALALIRIPSLGADMSIASITGASGFRITLAVDATGKVRVDEAGPSGTVTHEGSVRVPAGEWTSVRWDVRDENGTTTMRLRVGDETVFDLAALVTRFADVPSRFAIGLATSTPTRVLFDSVTYATTEP